MDRGLTGERQPGSKGCFGRRRCCALWFFLLLLLGGCEFQRQSPPEVSGSDDLRANAAAEVEAMLLASAASWNGGDLDGFLDDYRRSEDLTFSGASGVTRGWEGVEARYRESYWAPGTVRDSLRFEGIEVVPLGKSTHSPSDSICSSGLRKAGS